MKLKEDLIVQTYWKLVELRLCQSRSEFSSDWLGREKSYWRSVDARRGTISFRAHAYLVQSLQSTGSVFAASGVTQTVAKGEILLALSKACLDYLLARSLVDAY